MKKVNLDQQLSLFSDEDFGISDNTALHQQTPKTVTNSKKNNQTDVATTTVTQTATTAGKSTAPQLTDPTAAEVADTHYDHTALFLRLAQSDFRRGFHLHRNDIDYIQKKGLDTIRQHAADFVAKRLAPAEIPNDGKQTPMRGHPVFLAQHATGCCCRGCFFKWHHIPPGRALTPQEQNYAVSVLMTWIVEELKARHLL